MSRVINSDSPGQIRNRLLKLVSNTISQINQNNLEADELNDAIAFIVLSLMEIERTIAMTTAPWEKREYWVKADQFRSEWHWVGEITNNLKRSMTDKGWIRMPQEISILKDKVNEFETSKRIPGNEFWKGAYSVLRQRK